MFHSFIGSPGAFDRSRGKSSGSARTAKPPGIRSNISSIKEKKALRRFIKIAKQLLPAKNWLVAHPAASQVHLNLADMKGLRSISKDSMGTFNIGIALIDNRSSVNDKWQFSPLLRFFVYMVLITDEELVILDNAS